MAGLACSNRRARKNVFPAEFEAPACTSTRAPLRFRLEARTMNETLIASLQNCARRMPSRRTHRTG